MSTLTPFGIAIRKLRLDKGLRLLDLAARLKCSPAFVSAIETGRKPIPDGFVVTVGRAMELSTDQLRELRRAADRTKKTVTVEKLPEDQRELVAAFARKIDELPPAMMAKLKAAILKSSEDDMPSKRKGGGILVPPLSTGVIRDYAEKVRTAFVEPNQIEFPIMDVIEFKLGLVFENFCFDVQDKATIGVEEGRVIAGKDCIILREDVYEGACGGNGRDRFTACHELPHFLIHREVAMPRMRDDADRIYCDAEWQADTFAGTLLMSPRHLRLFSNSDHAAGLCKMTPAAASVMWTKYQSEGRFKVF